MTSMADVVLDGVVEEIKKLEGTAKCPFCGQQLKFKEYDQMFDPEITLRCEKCSLDFKLKKRTSGFLEFLGLIKPKWRLTKIRKDW